MFDASIQLHRRRIELRLLIYVSFSAKPWRCTILRMLQSRSNELNRAVRFPASLPLTRAHNETAYDGKKHKCRACAVCGNKNRLSHSHSNRHSQKHEIIHRLRAKVLTIKIKSTCIHAIEHEWNSARTTYPFYVSCLWVSLHVEHNSRNIRKQFSYDKSVSLSLSTFFFAVLPPYRPNRHAIQVENRLDSAPKSSKFSSEFSFLVFRA